MNLSLSFMLAVEDASVAAEWYVAALGASELWSLGSVRGLELGGATFLLHESNHRGFSSPALAGLTTVRIEVFVDDPDAFIEMVMADEAVVDAHRVESHSVPWGVHRQGGFTDPFGHIWLVGDRSPLTHHLSGT
jgi:PhnB protein